MWKRILPPTYFMLACAALRRAAVSVGALPIIFDAAFNLWADREFKRVGTTVKPFEESTSLLTGGPPFRFRCTSAWRPSCSVSRWFSAASRLSRR